MSEVSETTLAYFAGMLDGDGYLYPFMHRISFLIRSTKKAMEENFAVS